jgi:hypothetical protein
MTNYCDGEKVCLKILTDLHIFSPPEYENVVYMGRHCQVNLVIMVDLYICSLTEYKKVVFVQMYVCASFWYLNGWTNCTYI